MAILEIEMEFPLMENKRKNQYERVSWKMAANNRNTQNCLAAINLISARHRTQNDDTQFLFSPKMGNFAIELPLNLFLSSNLFHSLFQRA